jgi:GNAT superfamily N-acetyltransferase
MTFEIREATNADGEAVRDVVSSVLAEYGLAYDPDTTEADLADLDSAYSQRGGVFRVVTAGDGAVVGCGGLHPVSRDEIELRKMYLLPGVRGRGIGRRLLEDLLSEARRRGFARVVLETASVLREAISLYRRAGFEPIGSGDPSGRCDQAFALSLSSREGSA